MSVTTVTCPSWWCWSGDVLVYSQLVSCYLLRGCPIQCKLVSRMTIALKARLWPEDNVMVFHHLLIHFQFQSCLLSFTCFFVFFYILELAHVLNTFNSLNSKAFGRKRSPAAELPGLTSRGDVRASGSYTIVILHLSLACRVISGLS